MVYEELWIQETKTALHRAPEEKYIPSGAWGGVGILVAGLQKKKDFSSGAWGWGQNPGRPPPG